MSQFRNSFSTPLATDEELQSIFTFYAPNHTNGSPSAVISTSKINNLSAKDNFRKCDTSPIMNKILVNKFRTSSQVSAFNRIEERSSKMQEKEDSEGSFQFKSQAYTFQQRPQDCSQMQNVVAYQENDDQINFPHSHSSSSEDSSLELLEFSFGEMKKFERDYVKQYESVVKELKSDRMEGSRQIRKKPLAGSILKLKLFANKTFQIESQRKNQNQKVTNKNTLEGKIKKKQKLEIKQNINPSVFKLLPKGYLQKQKKQTVRHSFYGFHRLLQQQFFNQIVDEGHRFKKVFNPLQANPSVQTNAPFNAKSKQEWMKYKQLNRKFVQFEANHATEITKDDESNKCSEKTYQSIYKVCVSQFCTGLKQQKAMEQKCSVRSTEQSIKKMINKKAFGNNKKTFQSIIGSFQAYEKNINLKYISLSSSLDLKRKQNQARWKEDCPEKQNIQSLYNQIFQQNQQIESSLEAISIVEVKNKFNREIVNYFSYGIENLEDRSFQTDLGISTHLPITCPLLLQQKQLSSFTLYLNCSHESLKEKRQKCLGTKISGKIIYQIENRINQIRFKEQKILRVVYGIVTNRKKFKKDETKYFNKTEGVSRNLKQAYASRRGEHEMVQLKQKIKDQPFSKANFEMFEDASRNNRQREQIDMIKKIKLPSNKIGNDLTNKLNDEGKSNQIQTNKRNSINASSEVYNNGKRSYFNKGGSYNKPNEQVLISGHYDERSKRKSGNSLVSEKTKADFESYVANLCHKKQQKKGSNKQTSKFAMTSNYQNQQLFISKVGSQQLNGRNSRKKTIQESPILRRENRKIIKYSKYPIEMGGVQFTSDFYETCVILYEIQNVNLKEVQLRFLRDRRKYSINKVKVVLPFGFSKRQASNKNSDKLENNKSVPTQVQSSIFHKTIKLLQILNCLGATVTLQENQSYSIPQKIQSLQTELVCFMLGTNIQRIWQIYCKFGI